MGERYIFSIRKLTRTYGKREVLKDIWLAFYPGAKIGVIGGNGAGKSTLLRIMAGIDKDFIGEAEPDPSATIGYVPQEPQLTPGKNVLENVEEAVADNRALLKRHEEIGDLMGSPEADFDKLMSEMSRVQDKIDAANAWELDRQLEIAMDAMRLPPGDAPVEQLSGGERRRVALCKTLLQKPDLLLLDEPTNHLDAESVAWLERHLEEYTGTVVAVTHDRYFLDNVAQWILELDRGHGFPYEGNYSGWLEQKQKRLELEEKQESARRKTWPASWSGRRWRRGPASPRARPVWRLSRNCSPGIRGTRRRTGHADPAGAAPGRPGRAGRGRPQGLRRQPADGGPELRPAARRHRRRHRPQRRRQDDAVPHDRRPGKAGRRQAARRRRRCRSAYVDQNRDALDAEQDGLRGDHRRHRSLACWASTRWRAAAMSPGSTSRGRTSRSKVGELSGGERNRVHLAKLLRTRRQPAAARRTDQRPGRGHAAGAGRGRC